MRRLSTAKGLALLLVLASGVFAAASPARAQCLITGPDLTCGAPVQLCGPAGGDCQWTLPDGSSSTARCITATAPGTYSLRFFDAINGMWFGPCTHSLGEGANVACSIDGPTSACQGEAIRLCGPTGDVTYEWSGPDGFAATSACVSVTTAGTYRLTLHAADGCTSTCEREVSFAACRTVQNCPKPACFWSRQCARPHHGAICYGATQVASIAGCVNERSSAFAWGDAAGAFCAALRPADHGLRAHAKRQVAAVWANVCAGALGLVPSKGMPAALDPATPVVLPGVATTVGAWLASSEGSLAAFEGRSLRDRGVKLAYLRIITVGWSINHGIGIGAVCGRTPTAPYAMDDESAADLEEEPLAAELADTDLPALEFSSPEPNPFQASTVIAYAVTQPTADEVAIGVYDVAGRLVRELVRARLQPGTYEVRWDGRDASGASVRDGLYFVMGRIGADRIQTRVTVVR